MALKKLAPDVSESTHRKNFISLLNRVAYKHNEWDVFTDFLKVTAISLNNSDVYHIATDEKTAEEREADYKQVFSKYSLNERLLFPQMLAELTLELEEYSHSSYVDVLGELFHAMDFQNEWKAQFFTPQIVSDMMGRISVNGNNIKAAIEEKGFISINEPCCGGGSMIFGGLNALREYDVNPCTQTLVIAGDLDARCVHMAYIQLSLYGIAAVVVQQNTLTLELFDKPWYTPVFVLNGWKYKMRRLSK